MEENGNGDKERDSNRDDKGRFVEGHDPTVYERKPGANLGGRPREPKRQMQDALDKAEEAMPDIVESMTLRATAPLVCPYCQKAIPLVGGDQRTGEYLVDRLLGKPKQAHDVGLGGDATQNALLLAQQLLEARSKPTQKSDVAEG